MEFFEGYEEDWIFSTIDRYHHLLMYDLVSIPYKIKTVTSDSAIVATKTQHEKNELLLLNLPEKLLKTNKDEAARCKHRDFSISGGLKLDHSLSDIVVSPGSVGNVKLFSCFGNQPGISVYSITHYGILEQEEKLNINLSCSSLDIIGVNLGITSSCHLKVLDLETGGEKINFDLEAACSKLKFLSENTLLTCEKETGSLTLFDLRERHCVSTVSKSVTASYAMDVHCDLLVRANSMGDIDAFDIRGGRSKLLSCFKEEAGEITPSVSCFDGKFIVTGGGGNISVFSSEKKMFVHEGHLKNSEVDTVRTLCGEWYGKGSSSLIFSSASDGSIHVWEPVLEI